ncbi:MAG: hypothetical protein JNM56_13560 [Planctomycetia bacterium]|nr:hypothetical protein [Planctomycetia bacterium]
MTLQLFGPNQPWQRLLDDQPVLSGRHPLHLYHGFLGAAGFWQRGGLSCYDPHFQAGYPKTPVFDGGSRPAELFLGLAGGGYSPRAYKLGLAVVCCLVPLLLVLSARGAGLGPGAACLAGALGMLIWWGDPCQKLLHAGDLDLLLCVFSALVHVGLLLWFHRLPNLAAWFGLLLSGCVGWFAQPLLFTLLLVPLLLVYYHSVGVRHGLGWHLALLVGLVGGLTLNAFWLIDWVEYWWLRVPLPSGERLLVHRTIEAFWSCSLWGGSADRALTVLLIVSGGMGVVIFAHCRERVRARLFALGMGGLLVLALAGTAWEPLGRVGAPQLLMPALFFAVLPAVHAWQCLGNRLAHWIGGVGRAALLLIVVLALGGWLLRADLTTLTARLDGTAPLTVGLDPERQSLLALLQQQTTPEARILWEDRRKPVCGSLWTALLPLWTQRAFVGGLDPDATMEHGAISLVERQLAGRPLSDWSDADLELYCRRYNLGWVVCWSPAAIARLDAWSQAGLARRTASVPLDGATAHLYRLSRPHSFVLKGQARWLVADCRRIVLGDVVPDDGRVVLSLHYQAGIQAAPSQVQVEREPDPHDPIPLVRLRLNGPVSRITLSWEGSRVNE